MTEVKHTRTGRTIRVEQHGSLGLLWLAGWLFTIGFLNAGFWKGFLALIVWPYFLGAHFSDMPPTPAGEARAPATAETNTAGCKAPPGAAALLEQDKKIIVFGEYHGTREMPALAGEVACAAATSGMPVTVALEITESEQPALSRFLSGELDEDGLFTRSRFWSTGRDGRNSVAMLDMLKRLRGLREAGFNVGALAVDAPSQVSEDLRRAVAARIKVPGGVDFERSFRDLHMAFRILAHVDEHRSSLVLFLVGNAHLHKKPWNRPSLNTATGEITHHFSLTVAGALPPEAILTLLITHSGGSANAFTAEGPGERPVQATEPVLREPAIALAPFPDEKPVYDGRAFVGRLTASPPASVVRGAK